MFLAYGALAQGLVDPSARVFCTGHAAFYGREFRCHKKGGHGWVDLRRAIQVSCDVYFYNLGRQLGIDKISEIATAFGFGQPTGVDLAFEKSGLVPSEEWARVKRGSRWYPGETISVSIGQGPLLVTRLQVARALAGLLEGGRLPTPHLFYSSQDPRTGEQLRYKTEFREGLAISPEKLAIVKDGMWAVVNEAGGTAFGSRVQGVEMGGKTGTVQVVGRETTIRAGADRARLQDHAWFAGFGPVSDPTMVVVVFVEHGGHGNLAAAPLAKALFEAKYGIRPTPPPLPSLSTDAGAGATPGIAPAALRRGRAAMIGRVIPGTRRLDLVVLGCALALSALGILFIDSATTGTRYEGLASRQAIWIAVGLGAMIVALLFDYRMLLKFSFAIYCVCLLPLVYLLFFGETIANVRSWIRVGQFQFQPAELSKIATALLVAYLFENEEDARLHASTLLKLSAIVGIPTLLVFLQPDMGLAITFVPLFFVGLLFGGMPARGWVAIFLIVAVVLGAGWFFLKDYQKQRIGTFLNPDSDVLGSGYQVRQSKIAVGSGGFAGKGFRSGTQSQLRFLPVQHTDFILAVIAEEWGFLGVILVLGLFAALFLRAMKLAQTARDRGGVFLVLALTGMMFFSVVINASMMIGLAPTTGIPLPLVSYGGSSIATNVPGHRPDPGRRVPAVRERVRKELLVNATPPETRVALTEDGRVVEVFHERRGRQSLVGNVYLGRVHRVLPGMQAAFVSIGLDRDAFLYVEDVVPPAGDFDFGEENGDRAADGETSDRADRPRIDDLVREGQEIVVQVTKDAVGSKGPRVTSAISLAGRTLVYLPEAREAGVSRRIVDDVRARTPPRTPREAARRGRVHRPHGGSRQVGRGARGGPCLSDGARRAHRPPPGERGPAYAAPSRGGPRPAAPPATWWTTTATSSGSTIPRPSRGCGSSSKSFRRSSRPGSRSTPGRSLSSRASASKPRSRTPSEAACRCPPAARS